jgi:hypothetical protein
MTAKKWMVAGDRFFVVVGLWWRRCLRRWSRLDLQAVFIGSPVLSGAFALFSE